ncbi:MAG: methyltransferase domain-containing protein [Burkholderiales bacterium]|nr:methyltransferase domain-containing protein [Burkholderiales bacterium]
MSPYHYGDDFYAYQQIGSLASARSVAPVVMRHLRPATILDVGCGAGAWVRAYEECGAPYVVGIDADYVRPDQLLFDSARFHAIDVAGVFRMGREFDLVQCLEVAEHLEPSTGEALLDNLVAHAPLVLFSAAPPGQGGENHINERPYDYWRDRFQARGYALYDFLRPHLRYRRSVEHWYRYNMLLFAREDAAAGLSPAVAATRVDPQDPVADLAPLSWRLRRRALATLPPGVVTRMASVKHRFVLHRDDSHAGRP